MAISIVQLETLMDDDYTVGLFRDLYRMNDFLKLMPVTEVAARKITWKRWDTLPSGSFRDLYEDYTDSTGDFQEDEDKIAIYGGVFKDDLARKKWTAEKEVIDPVEAQFQLWLKTMDREITDEIINGTTVTDQKSFDGIEKRLSDGTKIDTSKTVVNGGANTNTFNVTADATNARAFFRKLRTVLYHMGLLHAAVKGQPKGALVMNSNSFLGIQYAAELANVALNSQMEIFEHVWEGYLGVPFIDAGLKVDRSTEIISNAMTTGDGSDGTKIYVMRFGEPDSVEGSNPGDIMEPLESYGANGVQLLQAGSFERLGPFPLTIRQVQHGLEWQLGMFTPSQYCLGAVQNIKFA